MVYELGVDIFVDAGHAEDVPAIVDIEKNVSVDVLIIFSVALPTFYYLGLVDCQIFVYIYLVDFALSLLEAFAISAVELIKDIT